MTKGLGFRPLLALCCGALAIDVNTALLALVDAAGLPTAHGGLLKLLLQSGGALLAGTPGEAWWRHAIVGNATTPGAQIGFHILVGLLMALSYAAFVARLGPRAAIWCAWAYAAFLWLLNAAVVLPAIGEGFAGSRNLSVAGMTAFAAIHTIFFVLLGWLYVRYARGSLSIASWPARPTPNA